MTFRVTTPRSVREACCLCLLGSWDYAGTDLVNEIGTKTSTGDNPSMFHSSDIAVCNLRQALFKSSSHFLMFWTEYGRSVTCIFSRFLLACAVIFPVSFSRVSGCLRPCRGGGC